MKPSLVPAPAQPARRSSRTRRNLISVGVLVSIIALCACTLYGYFVLNSHGYQQSSSNTLPGSNVIFSDPLNSPASGWSNDTNHCFFQDNSYHIKNSFYCIAPTGNISDADITVQAKQVAESTLYPYGIVFRRTSPGNWYEFDIDSNSKWLFFKSVNDTDTTIVDYTPDPAIKGGLNTVNTLRVEIKGSHFVFFVNNTQVGQADDTTFSSGLVGLSAGGTTTEVAYTNFEIDKVS